MDGWLKVQEYLSDDLASDYNNEKQLASQVSKT